MTTMRQAVKMTCFMLRDRKRFQCQAVRDKSPACFSPRARRKKACLIDVQSRAKYLCTKKALVDANVAKTPVPQIFYICGTGRARYLPAANALTASVVSAFPPMPHSPLLTSSIVTQVTWRMFSPSIETIASVTFSIIAFFCESEKTPSMTFTCTNGINNPPFSFNLLEDSHL